MERALNLGGNENIVIPSDGKTIAQTIINKIDSSGEGQLDVIFAHNENGILRFSDGSVIDSTWIGKLLEKQYTNYPIM